MRGLWIDEKTFIKFTDERTSLTEELATRKGAIDFYSLGMYLPNPDPVLKKQGKDITVYKELLTDAHVGGCVTSRKSGVLSLEWSIDRGRAKSRQAKLVEKVFQNLNLEKIMSEILDATLFGYSVLEVIWEKLGGYILPKAIVGKPQEWFLFSIENELRLRTKDNFEGIPLPEKKFLLVQHEATYQNPYGFPSLSRCFWPVTFKKGGLKFWVIFTEKYGMPFLIGKHPRGTSKEETDRLADLLEAMVQDAVAVIPDDSSIEIKEAGKSASADIYRQLIEYCDTQISIAILGQNLSTQVEGGSYAAAQAHMQVRKDIIEADKRLVEKALNQLIKWIAELNFGGTEFPVFSMWEQEDVDKALAERDKILVDTGVRFTKKYFQKAYGFEDEDIEAGEVPQQPQEFAEKASSYSDQQAVDDAMNALSDRELQEQMQTVLRPVLELIAKGSTYEEIMENLIYTYPEMDTTEIERLLARAIFVSELWGRLNAER